MARLATSKTLSRFTKAARRIPDPHETLKQYRDTAEKILEENGHELSAVQQYLEALGPAKRDQLRLMVHQSIFRKDSEEARRNPTKNRDIQIKKLQALDDNLPSKSEEEGGHPWRGQLSVELLYAIFGSPGVSRKFLVGLSKLAAQVNNWPEAYRLLLRKRDKIKDSNLKGASKTDWGPCMLDIPSAWIEALPDDAHETDDSSHDDSDATSNDNSDDGGETSDDTSDDTSVETIDTHDTHMETAVALMSMASTVEKAPVSGVEAPAADEDAIVVKTRDDRLKNKSPTPRHDERTNDAVDSPSALSIEIGRWAPTQEMPDLFSPPGPDKNHANFNDSWFDAESSDFVSINESRLEATPSALKEAPLLPPSPVTVTTPCKRARTEDSEDDRLPAKKARGLTTLSIPSPDRTSSTIVQMTWDPNATSGSSVMIATPTANDEGNGMGIQAASDGSDADNTSVTLRVTATSRLNDEIIRVLLEMFNPDHDHIKIMSSHLIGPCRPSSSHDKLRGLTSTHEQLVFPLFSAPQEHWTIAIATVSTASIAFYDPLTPSRTTPQKAVQSALEQLLENNFPDKTWKTVTHDADVRPQQRNGYDCGVLILIYAFCHVQKETALRDQRTELWRGFFDHMLNGSKMEPERIMQASGTNPEDSVMDEPTLVQHIRLAMAQRHELEIEIQNADLMHRLLLAVQAPIAMVATKRATSRADAARLEAFIQANQAMFPERCWRSFREAIVDEQKALSALPDLHDNVEVHLQQGTSYLGRLREALETQKQQQAGLHVQKFADLQRLQAAERDEMAQRHELLNESLQCS